MQKLLLSLSIFISGCSNAQNSIEPKEKIILPNGQTIQKRFAPPKGFQRNDLKENGFGYYLCNLPLKPIGSKVHYYNGSIKEKTNVYCGVVSMDVGTQDLQQCADAVMRLRGEYLFAQQNWGKLGFEFTKDQQIHYFYQEVSEKNYPHFRSWMNKVFAFANTRSLHHQLKKKSFNDVSIGDVLIQTGEPYGHAVIVVDIAMNIHNGDKAFMLAQSYMPAQEIQILLNPNQKEASPWYQLSEIDYLISTPEWTFTTNDLRTWE